MKKLQNYIFTLLCFLMIFLYPPYVAGQTSEVKLKAASQQGVFFCTIDGKTVPLTVTLKTDGTVEISSVDTQTVRVRPLKENVELVIVVAHVITEFYVITSNDLTLRGPYKHSTTINLSDDETNVLLLFKSNYGTKAYEEAVKKGPSSYIGITHNDFSDSKEIDDMDAYVAKWKERFKK